MKVLITGGAGFIGSNLIPYLLRQARADQDLEVQALVNFDKLTCAGHLENLADCDADLRYRFVQGDVCDRALLAKTLAQHDIDTVIHLAAESHPERSIADPEPCVTTNLLGTFQLLEACRAHLRPKPRPFRFLHLSSGAVFGSLDAATPAPLESASWMPSTPYAATKAGASHLVHAFAQTYGLPAVTVAASTAYGPFQPPEFVIPTAIRRIAHGQPVLLPGDGTQTRDWLFVEDLCRGLMLALLQGSPGECYHLAAQNERQHLEIVRHLITTVHALQPGSPRPEADDLIRFSPAPAGMDQRSVLDSSRMRQELGWSPRETLESGLRKTVQWYLDNEDWIEAVEAKRQARPAALPIP